MTLRTLMQAGPAKANELFARLAETSNTAIKTRERLFSDLKTELETHVNLEEEHLFPDLRRHAETRHLATEALKDNKVLRAMLEELDALAKDDDAFLTKLSDLSKAFRQHARDEKKELLPAVRKTLNEEEVQGITGRMETSLAEAEEATKSEQDERRATARRERENAEQDALHEEQEVKKRERQSISRSVTQAVEENPDAMVRTAKVMNETAGRITKSAAEGTKRLVATPASPLTTGFPLWDMLLGISQAQPLRLFDVGRQVRGSSAKNQVIPLAEEVLTVGTRTVSAGTTRVHRYVVETPVEKEVTLVRERVVVERRRPVTDKLDGETLTEVTVEVTETDEVPVVGKTVRLKEEIVVRCERTERVEAIRDTVRQDEVEIEHGDSKGAVRHSLTGPRGA